MWRQMPGLEAILCPECLSAERCDCIQLIRSAGRASVVTEIDREKGIVTLSGGSEEE